MLPFWSRHFDLALLADGYADPDRVGHAYPLMNTAEFERTAGSFDTILYHFGNSPYHAQMYRLLPRYPGIVVMHDFFLSGLLYWMDDVDGEAGLFHRELAAAHGMKAALDVEAFDRGELGFDGLTMRYAASRKVVRHARGVIFHSRFAERLATETYPDLADVPRCVVPQACSVPNIDADQRAMSRAALDLRNGDILVCAFGFLVETKDNELLIEALSDRRIADDDRIRVAFVGQLDRGPLQQRIEAMVTRHPMRQRIRITGYVDDREYTQYLAACDIGVSLRSNSRGETSAAMQKQLAAGCATIVSDHAAMSELPDDVVLKVVPSNASALARVLKLLADDAPLRASLGAAARGWIEASCHPARVAQQYANAIASLTELDSARNAGRLLRTIAEIADAEGLDDKATTAAGGAIASGLALHPASTRWLPRSS